MLMNLAEHISEQDMNKIAIRSFKMKKPKVDNLYSNRKSAEDFNCEVLILWRKLSPDNTKEVIDMNPTVLTSNKDFSHFVGKRL